MFSLNRQLFSVIIILLTTRLPSPHFSFVSKQVAQLNLTKFLNIPCNFEKIPGGGCVLRESYCSAHSCVCKPTHPINIDDTMCIQRYKNVGEICTVNEECGSNAYCVSTGSSYKLKKCICRQGYAYSPKNSKCIKGHKGASCSMGSNCHGFAFICILSQCQCNYGYGWHQQDEHCYKKSRHGEACNSTINCWAYDALSECDHTAKVCICRQFLPQRYAIGQLTKKCEVCPDHRYDNITDTCMPETLEIVYRSDENSIFGKNSVQYLYIILSMTPFVLIAAIAFFHKYVKGNNLPQLHFVVTSVNTDNARNAFLVNSECGMNEVQFPESTSLSRHSSRVQLENSNVESCCPSLRIELPPATPNLSVRREPPPPYEEMLELPPSYEEATAQNTGKA